MPFCRETHHLTDSSHTIPILKWDRFRKKETTQKPSNLQLAPSGDLVIRPGQERCWLLEATPILNCGGCWPPQGLNAPDAPEVSCPLRWSKVSEEIHLCCKSICLLKNKHVVSCMMWKIQRKTAMWIRSWANGKQIRSTTLVTTLKPTCSTCGNISNFQCLFGLAECLMAGMVAYLKEPVQYHHGKWLVGLTSASFCSDTSS